VTDLSAYSFCEPSTAGPSAPWCIRKLSKSGRKLSGGVDTASLCGRVKPSDVGGWGGWDVAAATRGVSLDHPFACKKCVVKLREVTGG
jgi:hypothetical protein